MKRITKKIVCLLRTRQTPEIQKAAGVHSAKANSLRFRQLLLPHPAPSSFLGAWSGCSRWQTMFLHGVRPASARNVYSAGRNEKKKLWHCEASWPPGALPASVKACLSSEGASSRKQMRKGVRLGNRKRSMSRVFFSFAVSAALWKIRLWMHGFVVSEPLIW